MGIIKETRGKVHLLRVLFIPENIRYNTKQRVITEELRAMEQLLAILRNIRPDVDFEKETSLVDDGILASFDIVTIVNELNDAYGVDISVADLDPENLNSAESMLALIQSMRF